MRNIEWRQGKIKIIDQNQLPGKLSFIYLSTVEQVVRAIKTMQVRGAPAIGVVAAFGCVLGSNDLVNTAKRLLASRPTAVNLKWGVQRIVNLAFSQAGTKAADLKALLLKEAIKMAKEDVIINKKMGTYGAKLIKSGQRILTVCNTGMLATVDYGTALGVIRSAFEQKKKIHVYAAETRPRLQGAKLTAWELQQLRIPFTLITDNMIAYHMRQGLIDLVIVGADRIARNGDVANKIGTYSAAVLAKSHRIPFYVAAPTSTIDMATASGDDINIEEREPSEVLEIMGRLIAPKGSKVANPAFDITPANLITGIITEQGVMAPKKLRV